MLGRSDSFRFLIVLIFCNLFFSTLFLVGPWQQIKNMLSRERFISSVVYLFAMFGTLYAVLVVCFFSLDVFVDYNIFS